MRLNFDMLMLNQMVEPVVLLDRSARVVGSNRAALQWVATCKAIEATLKRWIDEEIRGLTRFPALINACFGSKASGTAKRDVWLCKNGSREYAILVVPDRAEPEPVIGTSRNFTDRPWLKLMADQARSQLQRLQYLLADSHNSSPVHHQLLERQCLLVSRLLQDVSALSELLDRDEVFGSERLDVSALMAESLRELENEGRQFSAAIDPQIVSDATIYGATQWMQYALRVLIEAVLDHAPAGSVLNLAVRKMGDFVVIKGGVGVGRSLQSGNTPVSDQSLEKKTHKDQPAYAAEVSMLLCRRIVELHGGTLKLELMESSSSPDAIATAIESFTLTLMTGAPVHERSRISCAQCRHVLQEQAYAQDLANLLSHS